jgi:hypothetical protein
MKSIYRRGVLEHVFDRNDQDKQIIRSWLLDESPLPNQSTNQGDRVKVLSHEAFKFEY